MESRAEAVPVNGVKFGHGPAMTVAEVGFLIVFVVEFDRGSADMAYLGRNFACDGVALNLQGYFGSWKEGNQFHRSEWELDVGFGQFVELGGSKCITFGVQLDFPGERLVGVPLCFVLVAVDVFEGGRPIQLLDGI